MKAELVFGLFGFWAAWDRKEGPAVKKCPKIGPHFGSLLAQIFGTYAITFLCVFRVRFVTIPFWVYFWSHIGAFAAFRSFGRNILLV